MQSYRTTTDEIGSVHNGDNLRQPESGYGPPFWPRKPLTSRQVVSVYITQEPNRDAKHQNRPLNVITIGTQHLKQRMGDRDSQTSRYR